MKGPETEYGNELLSMLSVRGGTPSPPSTSLLPICINSLMRGLTASPRLISVLFMRMIHEKTCPTLRGEAQPSDHCLLR